MRKLNTKRSLLKMFLLNLVTLGIYRVVFFYRMAKDLDCISREDAPKTEHPVFYALAVFFTCGLYMVAFCCRQAQRMRNLAPRYGCAFEDGGATILLCYIVGYFLCGDILRLYADSILIKHANTLLRVYNAENNLS